MRCNILKRAVLFQGQDRIAGAPELECAGALQILAFAIEATAEKRIEPGFVDHRGRTYLLAYPGVRQVDIRNIRCGLNVKRERLEWSITCFLDRVAYHELTKYFSSPDKAAMDNFNHISIADRNYFSVERSFFPGHKECRIPGVQSKAARKSYRSYS